jgi:nitroimidazol reductase NimA-like FMN-containing flavoprotein (pyridoxamine 5'-phosphate oxidase superfamily)
MAFRQENRWSRKARGTTADEIMSTPVHTVGDEDELATAAARMVVVGVTRLPVVDADGRLVGILSRQDVLRHLAEPDAVPSVAVPSAAPSAPDVELRTGLTVLTEPQCWELLRRSDVGRLAVGIGGRPDIFPVNHVVDHGTIVFRTAEGTKLAAAVLGRAVAFEVDGYDPRHGSAWSVVVKGRAVEIERVHELLDANDLPLFPWHTAPKPRYVRIEPAEVTGRSFAAVRRQVTAGPTVRARAAVE